MTNGTATSQKSPRALRFPPLQKGGSRGDLYVQMQKQAVTRAVGIGLAVFIAVYFVATLCFIILE